MGLRVIGLIWVLGWAILGCSSSHSLQERTKFTHLDSLTDTYLTLQDSVLQSWNRVLKLESDKSKTLQELISQVTSGSGIEPGMVESLKTQLAQLEKIRFNTSTLSNPHVVNEYDQACQSLVQALVELAKTRTDFAPPHSFVSDIHWMEKVDRLSFVQRNYYDSLAQAFNRFVEANRTALKEIERSGHLDTKPLFKSDTAGR
jgi:hypothetical protein